MSVVRTPRLYLEACRRSSAWAAAAAAVAAPSTRVGARVGLAAAVGWAGLAATAAMEETVAVAQTVAARRRGRGGGGLRGRLRRGAGGRAGGRRATCEAVSTREDGVAVAVVHRLAIGRHESHAPLDAVEDDLVVAHCRGPDDGAVAVVVVDAHAPHTRLPLIHVLRRLEHQLRPARELERVILELVELRDAHAVAVVVRVLALDDARAACAPRADAAPAVACLIVRGRRQVRERRPRVDDRARVDAR